MGFNSLKLHFFFWSVKNEGKKEVMLEKKGDFHNIRKLKMKAEF